MSVPGMVPRTFNIALMALGGQGGGVLVDWIVDLAEHAGWTAQATSVAGVAQRTGATIYYVELAEPTPGREPVLALMPVPGEVDVLIAAELMEAGRAVARGLVTPERTTVIASSHRIYAVQEKGVPGNGAADSGKVLDIVRRQARQAVIDDMQMLAARHGSVISASLFGALAGSGALPFAQADFEAVVERSGVGVKTSLAALRAAAASVGQPSVQMSVGMSVGMSARPSVQPFARPSAQLSVQPPAQPSVHSPAQPGADLTPAPARALPERAAGAALQPQVDRIRAQFPPEAWDWLGEGLARVVDWQDVAYGDEYLDRVAHVLAADNAGGEATLAVEAARWIAVAMSYDDAIRVADLKTRAERSARVRAEIGAGENDVIGTEEYFHPRLEEVMGLMPVWLADWLDASPRVRGWLAGWFASRLSRGRRIQTHTLAGHVQLRLLAGLRRGRRGNRRHVQERAHLDRWLAAVERALAQDRALAIELLRCRQLVKGYSDTHARGSSRFDRLMRAADQLRERSSDQTAAALGSLREAARRDAEGRALDAQLHALGLSV